MKYKMQVKDISFDMTRLFDSNDRVKIKITFEVPMIEGKGYFPKELSVLLDNRFLMLKLDYNQVFEGREVEAYTTESAKEYVKINDYDSIQIDVAVKNTNGCDSLIVVSADFYPIRKLSKPSEKPEWIFVNFRELKIRDLLSFITYMRDTMIAHIDEILTAYDVTKTHLEAIKLGTNLLQN